MKETDVRGAGARVGGRTVESIRADFPILGRQVRGRPLAYLDNAATTQKPEAVIEALAGYYLNSNANVHRAVHALAEEATAAYEEARRAVARFVGAAKPEEIVFTRGATEAINLAAGSWGRANLRRGDEVLLTEMEHHSNLVPWQLLAAERGLRLRFLPFDDRGVLELDRLEELWSERTRLVALAHVSNVFGTVNDVSAVADFAHARGATVLVDAAQSVPHMPVDARELGADFLAFSGHKMCGPMGIGALYGREELLERMPPWMGGGEMIRSVWLDRAEWNDLPYKFEAGTPNVEGAVGLAAAIRYLEALGMEAVRAYEGELTRYALDRLSGVAGITLYGPDPDVGPGRGAVLSFNLEGVHPHDTAQFLDAEGIAVRAGHHCAHPLMRRLGVPATARASLYFYNTSGEIDRLAGALERTREFFGHGL